MGKDKMLSARVSGDLYEKAKDSAEDRNMSLSEFVEDALNDSLSDTLTAEDVESMDWDEKLGVIDEYDLDIDPGDYDNDEQISDAIIDELGLVYNQDENPDEVVRWLIFIPVVAFAVWIINKLTSPKQVE